MMKLHLRAALLAVLVPFLAGTGCDAVHVLPEPLPDFRGEGFVEVRFGPAGEATKAEPGGGFDAGAADSAVGNYMLLLFNADGSLFLRDLVTGSGAVTEYVRRDTEYHIYAIANLDTASGLCSSLNSVSTESAFLGLSYRFSDAWTPGKGWLAVSGEALVRTFTGGDSVTVSLDRVVARIDLDRIDFCADDASMLDDCTFDGVYLINTVDEMTFGGDALWYTNCSVSPQSGFIDSDCWTGPYWYGGGRYRENDYRMEDIPLSSCCEETDGVFRCSEEFTLYCLQNPLTSTTYGCLDPCSNVARQTRLVVSICDCSEDNDYACYPLTVTNADGWMEANRTYHVTYTVNLDHIDGIERRTLLDGMDWDTGSVFFGSIDIDDWDTGGTYTEYL